MCTKKEVVIKTLVTTANFKGQNPKLYKLDNTLKDLGWDDMGLSFLAMSLRALIGACSGVSSIYTSELRKKKFSINSLVKIMIIRILDEKLNDNQIKEIVEAAQEDM